MLGMLLMVLVIEVGVCLSSDMFVCVNCVVCVVFLIKLVFGVLLSMLVVFVSMLMFDDNLLLDRVEKKEFLDGVLLLLVEVKFMGLFLLFYVICIGWVNYVDLLFLVGIFLVCLLICC